MRSPFGGADVAKRVLTALGVRLQDERGIALVTALGVLFVLSLTLTALVYYTSTNSRTSARERADQQARALAEAGINNALAVLYKDGVDLRDPSLLPDGSAGEGIVTKAYEGGRSEWQGVLLDGGDKWYWEVTARGIVKNPTGPAAQDIRRTVTAHVRFSMPQAHQLTSPVWNWIYSGATGAECDTTIDQSVAINAPLYVVGNLCMRSTAKVVRGNRPLAVVVEGKATLAEPQNAIGTSTAKIDQVYVGNGCQYKNNAAVTPCTFNTHDTNVWAAALYPSDALLRIAEPQWAEWYRDASPGPMSPCATSSGTPPVFDVDTFLGVQTVPGVFHLTPQTASYSCATRRGEISWNHQTKILKVRGTIFIDGSAKIENGLVGTYDAFSAIYLTGTLLIKNSSLCAFKKNDRVGEACDQAAWNPNERMLIFAANGSGGQVPADTSIQLVSSEFQGGLYGRWAVNSSTTTSTQGPQVSEDDVQIGQSNNIGFPLITQVPAGTPLNEQPAPVPEAPDVG
jgi:hypothetical protein